MNCKFVFSGLPPSALAGCHLPLGGRQVLGSLQEGAVERSETEGALNTSFHRC